MVKDYEGIASEIGALKEQIHQVQSWRRVCADMASNNGELVKRYDRIIERYRKRIEALENEQSEMESMVNSIEDDEIRQAIIMKYFHGDTWNHIALVLYDGCISPDSIIKRTHRYITMTERLDYARRLERIESEKAKKRMSDGGKGRQNSDNLRTDEIVAKQTGIGSRDTLRKASSVPSGTLTTRPPR